MCRGRTTEKCLVSRVATRVTPRRSAKATTQASAPRRKGRPRRREENPLPLVLRREIPACSQSRRVRAPAEPAVRGWSSTTLYIDHGLRHDITHGNYDTGVDKDHAVLLDPPSSPWTIAFDCLPRSRSPSNTPIVRNRRGGRSAPGSSASCRRIINAADTRSSGTASSRRRAASRGSAGSWLPSLVIAPNLEEMRSSRLAKRIGGRWAISGPLRAVNHGQR